MQKLSNLRRSLVQRTEGRLMSWKLFPLSVWSTNTAWLFLQHTEVLGDKVTSIRPSWTDKVDVTGVFETSWAEIGNDDDGVKAQRGWSDLDQPGHAGSDKHKTYFKHHLQAGIVPNVKHGHVPCDHTEPVSFCCFSNQIQRTIFSKCSCAVYSCSVPRGWRLYKMLDCFPHAPLKPSPTWGIWGKSGS